MKISTSLLMDASPEKVWEVVTSVDQWDKAISGIKKIEVLEQPDNGLVGLKWRETRQMFGKEATEVMWITDVDNGVSYKTRAESHGAIYISGTNLSEEDGKTRVTQYFEGIPQSFGAKLSNNLFGWLMKSSVKKAFDKDLVDIKKYVESKAN